MKHLLFPAVILFFSINTESFSSNTFISISDNSHLLLSEISPVSSNGDWVELFFFSDKEESINISSLYVTMYYGENEKLSSSPVTLFSFDKTDTPWDDRFAVVHLTDGTTADETDSTGDSNKNGMIDIYCSNYVFSLWNNDCAVAIDEDDDPSNGMIDFFIFSDTTGTVNDSITGYISQANNFNQWNSSSADSAFIIPENGIQTNQVLCRNIPADSNSRNDWYVSYKPTPGKFNSKSNIKQSSKLFRLTQKQIVIQPQRFNREQPRICVDILSPCDIKLRIFRDIGSLIYESSSIKNLPTGKCSIPASIPFARTVSGLYIGLITATSSSQHTIQSEKIIVIISRY